MSAPGPKTDSEAGQQKLREAEKRFDEAVAVGLRALAVDPAGRAVLRWLLGEVTGTMAPTFQIDPHAHAYRAGKREVGLALLDRVEAVEPGTYALMAAEAAAEEAAALNAASNATRTTERTE